MGATYLPMQLRRQTATPLLPRWRRSRRRILAQGCSSMCPSPLASGWPFFPISPPSWKRTLKALSARLGCLIVLLLSADEDELTGMFFRDGKQLPWFKVGAPRKRVGKERDKLAAKFDALASVCDAATRARLVEVLADTTGVTFSSDLLRAVCELLGIGNAFTSFEYSSAGVSARGSSRLAR